MRGFKVWQLIFFIAAFIALLSAAFMYASSENSKAEKAGSIADAAIQKAEDLEVYINKLAEGLNATDKAIADRIDVDDGAVKRLAEMIAQKNHDMDKLRQKIEWLEMKANNQQKPGAQKMILSQEEPLKMQIIYRKAAPAKKLTDAQIKSKVINKIKGQMRELDK